MKNITLSIDDGILKAGREYTRTSNISFNVLVRRLIEQTVMARRKNWLDATFSLIDRVNAVADEVKWTRDELYRFENTAISIFLSIQSIRRLKIRSKSM